MRYNGMRSNGGLRAFQMDACRARRVVFSVLDVLGNLSHHSTTRGHAEWHTGIADESVEPHVGRDRVAVGDDGEGGPDGQDGVLLLPGGDGLAEVQGQIGAAMFPQGPCAGLSSWSMPDPSSRIRPWTRRSRSNRCRETVTSRRFRRRSVSTSWSGHSEHTQIHGAVRGGIAASCLWGETASRFSTVVAPCLISAGTWNSPTPPLACCPMPAKHRHPRRRSARIRYPSTSGGRIRCPGTV